MPCPIRVLTPVWCLMALWSEHLRQTRKGWAGVDRGRDSSKASSSGLQLFYTLDAVALNPGNHTARASSRSNGCRCLPQTRKTRDFPAGARAQVKGHAAFYKYPRAHSKRFRRGLKSLYTKLPLPGIQVSN